MSEENPKQTPLYALHGELGGKLVPFAGYWLPVQYETGVIAEHNAVRTACGLFDVSHMGEVTFQGPGALDTLQALLCNDMSGMADGQVRYSPMLYPSGGVVDDVLVYKRAENDYLVVVNAANRAKDAAWMQAHLAPSTAFADRGEDYAQLALQGPKTQEILLKLLPVESLPQKYYHFFPDVVLDGVHCLISRTGYTGEDGFELYMAPADATRIARLLLDAGRELGLIPCGLGCRDTLRLEAAMPLYGHEMDETVSPLETGLGRFVKLQKANFLGKAALVAAGEPARARIGLRVTGRGIAREHQDVYLEGKLIGHTTSGTHCPTVGPVAMALVDAPAPALGTAVEIDVRGRRVAAEVVPLPFYSRKK